MVQAGAFDINFDFRCVSLKLPNLIHSFIANKESTKQSVVWSKGSFSFRVGRRNESACRLLVWLAAQLALAAAVCCDVKSVGWAVLGFGFWFGFGFGLLRANLCGRLFCARRQMSNLVGLRRTGSILALASNLALPSARQEADGRLSRLGFAWQCFLF